MGAADILAEEGRGLAEEGRGLDCLGGKSRQRPGRVFNFIRKLKEG
jgi:hypothetical protein